MKLPEYAALHGLGFKREIERNGSQFLLKEVLGKHVEPVYTDQGKPFLEGENCHISISHSHDMLAVCVNNAEATGIDIELIRDKVIKIRHKFLNKAETNAAGNNIEKLIVYWACKESLYKIYGLKEVDFIQHLFVNDFELSNEGDITGEIKMTGFNKKYKMHYQKLQDYMLVYILNEIK